MKIAKYILFALEIILLIVSVIIAVRIFRYIKSLPENEELGEERAKKLNAQIRSLLICIGSMCVLSAISTVLRFF